MWFLLGVSRLRISLMVVVLLVLLWLSRLSILLGFRCRLSLFRVVRVL